MSTTATAHAKQRKATTMLMFLDNVVTEKVMAALLVYNGGTQMRIAHEAGVEQSTASNILHRLAKIGIINIREAEEAIGRGVPRFRYFLNSERIAFINKVTKELAAGCIDEDENW